MSRIPYASLMPPAVHPIQTMLTCLSGAYLLAVLGTDLAYWGSANIMWVNFSSWLLVAGLFAGGFAILATLVNLVRQRRVSPRRPAWLAFLALLVIWALSLTNAFVHSRDGWTSVVPTGLALSAAAVLLLLVLAWLGWSTARRHSSGVLL